VKDTRILVVNDSPTMRRIIINTLNRIGYTETTEASCGRDALLAMKEQTYNLVITDWCLPELDGVTLTCIMRRSQEFYNIPILMVTTRSTEDDIMAAVKAGVNGYLVKPFTVNMLKEKIEQILSGV
jgi:two-component system, chemotaxis family, chemotaxis protein CheY